MTTHSQHINTFFPEISDKYRLEILKDLKDQIDIIILDPPRTGCHPDAIESVISSKATKLAYVSCDPPSLARDLDKLVQQGYKIDTVTPIDMFPQTYHIECVTTLSLDG